ncbi:hypothetical protein DET56_101703 [Paenibacillus pabuli]|uniref:Uncharacterized protein n=1 Tax=Paenibacillus pabuli TaxID=1472 RepID=A0A855YKU2_9BACL|nr:hypothetical protein DET56_101703 [Paenibacillus pabuli]PXW11831.1 hypothetical protein DEU73_101702 [Paenibacillus taichungensis]
MHCERLSRIGLVLMFKRIESWQTILSLRDIGDIATCLGMFDTDERQQRHSADAGTWIGCYAPTGINGIVDHSLRLCWLEQQCRRKPACSERL